MTETFEWIEICDEFYFLHGKYSQIDLIGDELKRFEELWQAFPSVATHPLKMRKMLQEIEEQNEKMSKEILENYQRNDHNLNPVSGGVIERQIYTISGDHIRECYPDTKTLEKNCTPS